MFIKHFVNTTILPGTLVKSLRVSGAYDVLPSLTGAMVGSCLVSA